MVCSKSILKKWISWNIEKKDLKAFMKERLLVFSPLVESFI